MSRTMLSKVFFVNLNFLLRITYYYPLSYQVTTYALASLPITIQAKSSAPTKLASSSTPWKLLSFTPGLAPQRTSDAFQESSDNSTNKANQIYHHEADLISTSDIDLPSSSSVYERLLILQTKANLIKNSNITTSEYFKKVGSDIVSSLASKLLSEETATAVKTIREILRKFPDHGVVDIFKLYSTRDLLLSFLALSRLQRFNKFLEEQDESKERDSSNHSLDRENLFDPNLIKDLGHYAVFANAAYGWKMRLLMSGKLHIGNMKLLTESTGIEEENIIHTNWRSKTHLPAFFIVRDVAKKNIVLCIRGTLSPKDLLTDLCCTADDYVANEIEKNARNSKIKSKYFGRAHHGMLLSARGVEKKAKSIIANALASCPDYNLVIIGHSLGGGVAAILGSLWKETFPGLIVYAYGCPCIGPLDTNPTIDNSIISVVGDGDPFSTLSLGHLADITTALSKLCEDESLRDEILQKTQSYTESTSEDLKWCFDTYQNIRSQMNAEKFYPPGRILYLADTISEESNTKISLQEVKTKKFDNIILHSSMFDLSRHVPNRYESDLSIYFTEMESRIASDVSI